MARLNYDNPIINVPWAFSIILFLVFLGKSFSGYFDNKISFVNFISPYFLFIFVFHPYTNNAGYLFALKIADGSWIFHLFLSLVFIALFVFVRSRFGKSVCMTYMIVTHLPAFYKVNLYNEIAKNINILVIFIGCQSSCRTTDFVSANCDFEHVFLHDGEFESRPKVKNILKLYLLVSSLSFKQLLVSGWDLLEYWFLILLNKKDQNNLALESTAYESSSSGPKGLIKRIFLSRVGRVLASGSLHKELLFNLGYKGDIRITKGVGIINKPEVVTNRRNRQGYQRRFLFLGRLSPEKNLDELLKVFRMVPCSSLTLIGNGPLKPYLSKVKSSNVEIKEHVDNKKLSFLFSEYDFLILPSLREPWGLVVEEALYFNVPVIVSSHCGGSELINHGVNGYVVEPDFESILNLLCTISENTYGTLSKDIYSDLADKDRLQINSYKDL